MPKIFKGFDFGIKRGLAVRVDTRQDIANLRANEQLDRQQKIDAQTKAKLFSDDLQFGKASNPWDHKQLKNFTEKKIRQIGEFVNQNPDFDTDPIKLATLKRLKADLIDNPVVYRSQRIAAHKQAMDEFAADPKNAALIQTEKFIRQQLSYENYVKTGSADPEKPGVEFTFNAPGFDVDRNKYFAERASSIGRNKFREYRSNNALWGIREADEKDFMSEALGILSSNDINALSIKRQIAELKEKGVIEDGQEVNWIFNQLWNNRPERQFTKIASGKISTGKSGLADKQIGPYDGIFVPKNPIDMAAITGGAKMSEPIFSETQVPRSLLPEVLNWNRKTNEISMSTLGVHFLGEDEQGNIIPTELESTAGKFLIGKPSGGNNIIIGPNLAGFRTNIFIPDDDEHEDIIEEMKQKGIIKEVPVDFPILSSIDALNSLEPGAGPVRFKTMEFGKGDDAEEKRVVVLQGYVPHARESTVRSRFDGKVDPKVRKFSFEEGDVTPDVAEVFEDKGTGQRWVEFKNGNSMRIQ